MLAGGLGLLQALLQRCFFLGHCALDGSDGGWHFRRQQDAFGWRGGIVLADELQDLAAIGLQHDQVASDFGFEFV